MEALSAWAAVAAAILAAGALLIAINANKFAKEGNRFASDANQTSADALEEAKEANRNAVDANELASGANTIAERALQVAQDDIPYNWRLVVNDDGSAEVLNDCGYNAFRVGVVVDCNGEEVAHSEPQDVVAFDKVAVDVHQAVDRHMERVRQHPYRPAYSSGPVFVAGSSGGPVSSTFRVHVRWFTEQDVPRAAVAQQVLRHSMTSKGMRRLAEKRRR